jgi:hypothetical protein
MDKPMASVPLIRPPRLDEMIERIAALKGDAQALGLEGLAYFLEMCLIEARAQAGRERKPQHV